MLSFILLLSLIVQSDNYTEAEASMDQQLSFLAQQILEIKQENEILRNQFKSQTLRAVPLGTIIPWVNKPNKSALHTEDIPEGWTICDGSVIVSGVWKGLATPDLNSEGRFVRGGLTSQVLDLEESMVKDHLHLDLGHSHTDLGHTHTDAGHTHAYNEFWLGGGGGYFAWGDGDDAKRGYNKPNVAQSHANIQSSSAEITSSNSGVTGVDPNSANSGDETRPINMRVIWLIKTEYTKI